MNTNTASVVGSMIEAHPSAGRLGVPPRRDLGGRDRRRSERHPVSAPCKLVARDGLRFVAGRVRNVSATGALVEVPASSVVPREGEVEALIDWSGTGLVCQSSSRAARVVRVGLGPGGVQLVGLRFVEAVGARRREAALAA